MTTNRVTPCGGARIIAAGVLATVLWADFGAVAFARTIIDDWAQVQAPRPPVLQSVTIEPATTALLLLDFNGHEAATSGPCNATNKPRCLASIPTLRTLLQKARGAGVLVVYSLGGSGLASDIQPGIAPMSGDPVVKSGPDKFVNTSLREILTKAGVKTVIVTGTASEGAVLATAMDAALNGLRVVVPVDGMSSTDLYAEQYVAWHLTHAPGVSQVTTLTRADMISF